MHKERCTDGNDFRRKSHDALKDFRAATAESGLPPDDSTRGQTDEESVLHSCAVCIRRALNPLGMHIRKLDRERNCLRKTAGGFGPYFEVAPSERQLRLDTPSGSVEAAARQNPIWCTDNAFEKLKAHLDRDVTRDQLQQLQRIRAYATLPLIFDRRFLGTLDVQFDDDSLFHNNEKDFLKDTARALSNVLGRLAWARERMEMSEHFRNLDNMMFSPELFTPKNGELGRDPDIDQEWQVVREAIEKVFDVTHPAYALYYQYDSVRGKLFSVPGVCKGFPPPGTRPPKELPGNVGIAGTVVQYRDTRWVPDFREDYWGGLRLQVLANLTDVSERNFVNWIRCVVAAPVVFRGQGSGDEVQGVLLAISPTPRWLSKQDVYVIETSARKIGLCLQAMRVTRHELQELKTISSISRVVYGMMQTHDETSLYRLYLLATTAGECLRFSRGILFLRNRENKRRLDAVWAVGSESREIAQKVWASADKTLLNEKIQWCLDPPAPPEEGDIRRRIGGLMIDLEKNRDLENELTLGPHVVRRRGQPHIVQERVVQEILCPSGEEDAEYVIAPLHKGENLIGVVAAIRAFLTPPEISSDSLYLLPLVNDVLSRQLELLREREMTNLMASGITYTLRTQAALLASRLWSLEKLGSVPPKLLGRLSKSSQFFLRAGSLAAKLLRTEQLAQQVVIDVNTLAHEVVEEMADPRIVFKPSLHNPTVTMDPTRFRDVVIELVLNACDFTDKETGLIEVEVTSSDSRVQVHVIDNGRGIPTDFRPRLFEKYQCFPADRMGLGLAYARDIARAYGGDLKETAPPRGAHFVVSLPVPKDKPHD